MRKPIAFLVCAALAIAALVAGPRVHAETRPVLVKFGAWWCGPCQKMDRDVFHDGARMDELHKRYSEVLIIDVEATDSATLTMLNAFKPEGGIPAVVVLDVADNAGNMPSNPNTEGLSVELAAFLAKHATPTAENHGFGGDETFEWMLNPTTTDGATSEEARTKPLWRMNADEALAAAYDKASSWDTQGALPYWKKAQKSDKLLTTDDGLMTALLLAEDLTDKTPAAESAKILIEQKHEFSWWLMMALEANPDLTLQAIKTYAGPDASLEQRMNTYYYAGHGAVADGDIRRARTFFSEAVKLDNQLDDGSMAWILNHGYKLSMLSVDETVAFLEERVGEDNLFIRRSEQADYLRRAARFADAEPYAVEAVTLATGVNRLHELERLAELYWNQDKKEQARETIALAVSETQELLSRPEIADSDSANTKRYKKLQGRLTATAEEYGEPCDG